MTDTESSFENIHLSKSERQLLERNLFLLDETLKAFPGIKLTDRSSVDQWARFEEWARLARSATHRVFDLLGPIQARSAETREAFLSAMDTFDQVTDIVERKYQQLTHDDFEAARASMQDCIRQSRRLLPTGQ